jgi:polysaccharide deacetylase 2 family uncharacterized protein YibQ
LRKKKSSNKVTGKEKWAAILLAALCIPVFLASYFLIKAVSGDEEDAGAAIVTESPAEKGEEQPVNNVPQPIDAPQPVNDVAQTARPEFKPAPPAKPAVRPSPPPKTVPPKVVPPSVQKPASFVVERPPEKPVPKQKGNIVFVIDDAGHNVTELSPFLQFPGAMTIAVLPGLPHSAQAARMIRAAGKQVFLHQPMEALGAQDPGPGAIYTGMAAEEVRAILQKNVAEIGPVAGMNNHQGSAVTEDSAIMKTVLEFCRENDLIFLDSRTTKDSVVPELAKQAGMKIAQRNIFLDNESDRDSIVKYINEGLKIVQKNNSALMIGHVWSKQLAGILNGMYQELKDDGYSFLSVSQLLENK